jgi:aspartyl protease family protein
MNRAFPWGHIAALAIWVALFGAIYLYFDAREKPTVAFATNAASIRGEVLIPRSRDGHYYVSGAINGHPVTFMVDTGASTVSIGMNTARVANLPQGTPAQFGTAGGTVLGTIVTGQTIMAGGIAVEGISIAVGIRGEIALLGQNFLRRVEMTQSGDTMTLRIKQN